MVRHWGRPSHVGFVIGPLGGDREDNLGTLDAAGAHPEARRGTHVEGNLAEAVGLEVDSHVGLWFIF